MEIRLPKIAEGAEAGTVMSVLVAPGDTLVQDQELLEVETDKAVVSIPSPAAGTVSLVHVKEGDTVRSGQLLVTLGDETGSAARATPVAAPPLATPRAGRPLVASTVPAAPQPVEQPGGVSPPPAAAPSLRKLARSLGIDLTRVRGTARGGRIVIEDVRTYIAGLQDLARTRTATPGAAALAPSVVEAIDFSRWGPVSEEPLSSLRRIVSRRMHASWSAVPHVTQFDVADVTALTALRKKHVAAYEKAGARLTLTPFVLQALVAALKKFPRFNASLDRSAGEGAERLVLKHYFGIGIAVDTEAGLMVPVVRDVDTKSLLELARETEELAGKARARKISPAEMQGGTFTVSNQGALGGGAFTPIVNHPEVAILGLGRATVQPVWIDGQPAGRQMLPIALSYDHRVVDGADAVRFVRELVTRLENPEEKDWALKTASRPSKKRR